MALELVRSRTAPTAIDAVATHRRRLMAVMLADVVGYSRMMSRSEDETHARFTRHARELIEPTIDKYHGRLVRSMGDGLSDTAGAHHRRFCRRRRHRHRCATNRPGGFRTARAGFCYRKPARSRDQSRH